MGSGTHEDESHADVRTAKQFMSGFSHISEAIAERTARMGEGREKKESQLNQLATKPNEVDVNKIAFHKFSFGKRKITFLTGKTILN